MTEQMARIKGIASRTILCVAVLLCILPPMRIAAQQDESRYFEETGHNVSGDFLRFYDERGGLEMFGYPLTRQFTENGRRVQYFQRVRMEAHPENPEPYKVQLGLLGDLLGYRTPPIDASDVPPPGHAGKRYFAETGHTVSFAFLEYYDSHGGLDIFGYPISEWLAEPNGRIVQYFQRGKMEWYPESSEARVQLGMLGSLYAARFVDPSERKREDPRIGPRVTPEPKEKEPTAPTTVSALRILVTLKNPIVGLNGKQTAYVYVFDQSNQGVPGLLVEMQVQYKGGRTEQLSMGPTNANGYCQIDFPIAEPTPGYLVILTLHARYQETEAQANAAFLPWW
jgi:hypothetical protein